ncbi:MAG: hypothetical protein WBY94_13260 [Polyangiaceae bacterium]
MPPVIDDTTPLSQLRQHVQARPDVAALTAQYVRSMAQSLRAEGYDISDAEAAARLLNGAY